MEQGARHLHGSSPHENISRTIAPPPETVTRRVEQFNHSVQTDPCGYVLEEGSGGGTARFCDAPAVPGSSYCAGHRALCQVAPNSAAAAPIRAELARAAERATLPPPRLDAIAVPEPFEECGDDVAADLPRVPREWEEM